jgi:toxin ParE1/3/4
VALRVIFSEQAWADADEIYDWIAANVDAETAERYVSRVIGFCDSLADFPRRGTPRDDVAPGLRTTSFEGRAIVAYVVEERVVRILHVLHHGRDLGKAFVP